ncbi:MAG: hypothetical protein SPD11_06235 [Sphaerochaetaceae bacterium]|nr:hypothetical protein [Sphaerochaetaceae bacterium]
MVLPNMNVYGMNAERGEKNVQPQFKEILKYLDEHKTIDDAKLQELLGVRKTRAYTISRQMIDSGLIVAEGKGSQKTYRVK